MMDVESHRATARPFTFHFLVHVHLLGRVTDPYDIHALRQGDRRLTWWRRDRADEHTVEGIDTYRCSRLESQIKPSTRSIDARLGEGDIGQGIEYSLEDFPFGICFINVYGTLRHNEVDVVHGNVLEDIAR